MPIAMLRGHGGGVYFESMGSGPPLIFIAGVGLDHTMWENQIRGLAPDFQCIVFDNPGTGQSTSPKTNCTIGEFGAQLWQVLDTLEIAQAHICGFSMGGMIALEAASIEPQRVLSLSLHSTASHSFAAFRLLFESLKNALDNDDGHSWARLSTIFANSAARLAADEALVVREIGERLARFESMALAHKQGLIIQYQALIDYHVGVSLDKIRCPCLVTVGTDDLITPPIYSEMLARDISHAAMVHFQRVGHRTPTLACQRFNDEMRSFLGAARLPARHFSSDTG